jgi:hypothetical protein
MADLATLATEIVTALNRRDYDAFYAFGHKMFAMAIPPLMLAETWNGVIRKAGHFQDIVGIRPYRHLLTGMRIAFVCCRFERMQVEIELHFDNSDKLAGLAMIAAGFE